MKNIPKKIYLHIADSDVTDDKSIDDWNGLFQDAIKWSSRRLNETDVEFVLAGSDRDLQLHKQVIRDLIDTYLLNLDRSGKPISKLQDILNLNKRAINLIKPLIHK